MTNFAPLRDGHIVTCRASWERVAALEDERKDAGTHPANAPPATVSVLLVNAIAILSEDRFLARGTSHKS